MGQILTLDSYLNQPSKEKYGKVVPPPDKSINNEPAAVNGFDNLSPIKVDFQTISDLTRKYEGKNYDEKTGTYFTAADYTKRTIGGTAGVLYHGTLLFNPAGVSAQLAVKGTSIALSTVNLTLGEGYGIGKAATISAVGGAFKGSLNGYGWYRGVVDKVRGKIGESNLVALATNKVLGLWQTSGQTIYKAYHAVPVYNPANLFGQGSHYGISTIPLQWFEANAYKKVLTAGFKIGKDTYEPYNTALSTIDQLHLQNHEYKAITIVPPNEANVSVQDYIKPFTMEGMTIRSTNPRGVIIDTVDPTPHKILSKPPPKEKTEIEKLQSVIAEFDKKYPDKWVARLERILQPELFANYDKAKDELGKLKAEKNQNVSTKVIMFLIGGLVNSLEQVGSGWEGSGKLRNGIDYNDEIINKLAQFKSDLEQSGGKFEIKPDGGFLFYRPPADAERKPAAIPENLKVLSTLIKDSPDDGGKAAISRQKWAEKLLTTGNAKIIRAQVALANKNAWTKAYWNFYKNNPTLVKGKWHADVIPLFYTANPQYAPKSWKDSQKINQMRADFYANPSIY